MNTIKKINHFETPQRCKNIKTGQVAILMYFLLKCQTKSTKTAPVLHITYRKLTILDILPKLKEIIIACD